jgi:pantoate--beta-alanine ligase
METVKTIAEVRLTLAQARSRGRRIALVPTMGAFHEGHLELMRWAKEGVGLPPAGGERSSFVAISIFVNPTQFGPNEDFTAYPRDLAKDSRLAESVGADLVFTPAVEEIYPPGETTRVRVARLDESLCGPFRPGHFEGVATIVAKLLNIFQPDSAYFGQKDYQQLKIIQQMARDLHFPVKIIPVPTVREADGLAMSSRNAYLSPAERAAAPLLYQGLQSAQALAGQGERRVEKLIETALRVIQSNPAVRIQYLELRNAETLEPLALLDKPAVLALAAHLGDTRLIDNVILSVP